MSPFPNAVIDSWFADLNAEITSSEFFTNLIPRPPPPADALSINQEWNLKVRAHKNSDIIKSFFNEFQNAFDKMGIRYIAFQYSENINQYKVIKEQVGTFNKLMEKIKKVLG